MFCLNCLIFCFEFEWSQTTQDINSEKVYTVKKILPNWSIFIPGLVLMGFRTTKPSTLLVPDRNYHKLCLWSFTLWWAVFLCVCVKLFSHFVCFLLKINWRTNEVIRTWRKHNHWEWEYNTHEQIEDNSNKFFSAWKNGVFSNYKILVNK